MATFAYSAISSSGKRVSGTLRSDTRRQAARQLIAGGYHPLGLSPVRQRGLSVGQILGRHWRRPRAGQLAVFSRQMSALLRAGMSVAQALQTLQRQSQSRRFTAVIGALGESLSRQGGSLSGAMSGHPEVFSGVYVSLIRSGEENGRLAEALNRLAVHMSRSARLRRQVIGAFVYPAFLVVLGVAAVAVLMTFVIPKFAELFESFGQRIPAPTKAMISASEFLSAYWWAVLLGMLAAFLLTARLLSRERMRLAVDGLLLRLPVIGGLLLKIAMARLARTMAELVRGEVGVLQTLSIARGTVGNRRVRGTFDPMIRGVSHGKSLAEAAEETGVYPALVIDLIRTGEQTGQLPEMLSELSEIYEDETERAIAGAMRLLEPALIIAMGGVVAAIVAAVLLPIFQANVMVE